MDGDQFFKEGFIRGALWYNAATLLGTFRHEPALSKEAVWAAMLEALAEYRATRRTLSDPRKDA